MKKLSNNISTSILQFLSERGFVNSRRNIPVGNMAKFWKQWLYSKLYCTIYNFDCTFVLHIYFDKLNTVKMICIICSYIQDINFYSDYQFLKFSIPNFEFWQTFWKIILGKLINSWEFRYVKSNRSSEYFVFLKF